MKQDTPARRSFASGAIGHFALSTLRAAAVASLIAPFAGAVALADESLPATPKNESPVPAKNAAGSEKSEKATQLDPVVVVASRTPEKLSEVSPSVSYIGIKELIPAGKFTLADVLREEQGVYTSSNGAPGSLTSIFTRGTNSSMTQVTLDGRRLNSGMSNFNASTLLTDNLSSVQMMRGASSTLYGANAMGGVIDLRSIDPFELDKPMASASGEGGSYGYWRTGFELAGTQNQFSDSAGPNSGNTGFGFSVGGSWTQTDNKRPNNDYRMANIMPRADYRVSENLSFNVVTRYYDYDMGNPGFITSPSLTDRMNGSNWLVSPGVKISLNDNIDIQAFYSYTKDSLESSSQWSHLSNETDKHEVTMTATWRINEMLEIGGGYTFEKSLYAQRDIRSGASYEARRDSNSPWFQMAVTPVENLKISGGARYNQFNAYDDAWTGEAGVSYKIAPTKTTLHARVASAYATPSATSFMGAYAAYSPPDLKPEENKSWEIGLKQEFDILSGAKLGVVYFENYLTDMIVGVPDANFNYVLENINKAKTRGVEFSGEIRPIAPIRFFANSTYLHTEDESNGGRLLKRPNWTVTLGVDGNPAETVTLGFSVTYVHGAEDYDHTSWASPTPRVDLKNYYYGRVYASWRFMENAEIFGRIENLFDQSYQMADGYPALPITAYAGMRFMF